MSRLRTLLSAAPPRDAALAAAIFVALLIDAELCFVGEGITPRGIAAAALMTVPLAWRTASPKLVLAIVTVGVFACLFTLKPVNTVALAPMLAAYTVALTGQRTRSVVTGVLSVSLALTGVVAVSGRVTDAILNASLMTVAVVAGDAVRTRRQYRATLLEREAEREAERERDAERRVADERVRIAQEVHDVVAHAMVAINVQAGVAAHLLDADADQAKAALVEIKRVSGSALGDLRSTLGLLRGDDGQQAPVRPVEVLAQLPELAEPLRAAGIEVDVRVDAGVGEVPTAVGTAAYRIVQEALTNALRHAAARRVTVQIEARDGRLFVDVHDDGAAPELVAAALREVPSGTGHGVRGMTERAAAIGGSLFAGPDRAGGWRVRAGLPLR